jgi:hypothetical protein
MHKNRFSSLKLEQKLAEWILRNIHSEFKWLRRILLKGLRFAWRHQPSPIEQNPKEENTFPSGPFIVKRPDQMGDLLLWVPRRLESYLIDDLTGRYGYSHASVDTGEMDEPTGKAVMVEVTIGQTVIRKFQDEYGGRPYARMPLSKIGIDTESFVNCVKSRLGEQYGDLEALTLGEIDDPAKQVCSSVAAECLPENVKREIAKARRLRLLHGTTVSIHSRPNAEKTKVFISPNGFARYFGAPRGEKLDGPDVLIDPIPMDTSIKAVVRKHGWKAVLVLAAAGMLTTGSLLLLSKHHRQNKYR